jgi:hypothetical protein
MIEKILLQVISLTFILQHLNPRQNLSNYNQIRSFHKRSGWDF